MPRVAFNLDNFFQKSHACGKQALTMCMGFGCNAAGVIGCRIIDSPRERLIAILTNNFVPCNGRFPTLITLITIFFAATSLGVFQSVTSALFLCAIIVFGVMVTLFVSKILSRTLLRGVPTSFTLERRHTAAAGWKNYYPLYFRPYFIRAGARGHGLHSGGAHYLVYGKYPGRRRFAVADMQRFFRPICPLDRAGRRYFNGVHFGVPCQRNCHSDYFNGIFGRRANDGI